MATPSNNIESSSTPPAGITSNDPTSTPTPAGRLLLALPVEVKERLLKSAAYTSKSAFFGLAHLTGQFYDIYKRHKCQYLRQVAHGELGQYFYPAAVAAHHACPDLHQNSFRNFPEKFIKRQRVETEDGLVELYVYDTLGYIEWTLRKVCWECYSKKRARDLLKCNSGQIYTKMLKVHQQVKFIASFMRDGYFDSGRCDKFLSFSHLNIEPEEVAQLIDDDAIWIEFAYCLIEEESIWKLFWAREAVDVKYNIYRIESFRAGFPPESSFCYNAHENIFKNLDLISSSPTSDIDSFFRRSSPGTLSTKDYFLIHVRSHYGSIWDFLCDFARRLHRGGYFQSINDDPGRHFRKDFTGFEQWLRATAKNDLDYQAAYNCLKHLVYTTDHPSIYLERYFLHHWENFCVQLDAYADLMQDIFHYNFDEFEPPVTEEEYIRIDEITSDYLRLIHPGTAAAEEEEEQRALEALLHEYLENTD